MQHSLPDIIAIKPAELIQLVLIVAVEVIGVMEWLKNFITTKSNGARACASFFVTMACALMNSILVSQLQTAIFDTIFLSLAAVQIGYDAIIKGVPDLISRAMGVKNGSNNGS